MTLFDNETSHSNEATATLTAPEGSTSTNHTEPGASPAESAQEAAATAPSQSDASGAALSTVPSTTETEVKADAPTARPAIELPAHEEAAAEDFATALENYENAAAAEPEESAADRLIKGTVVKITATHVVVDFGAKSEGVVPIAEVQDHTGTVKFKAGDEIPVMVDRSVSADGAIGLSYQKAQRLHAWDDIEKAYNEKKPIAGIVIDRIKGGVTVDINGARAFLPGSQVDVRPVHNLDALKGQTFDVAIIKLNKKRGNIVVSRKQLLEEEVNAKRTETLSHLEEGSILTGTVKNLTEYGAFVDLGGLDGLLHITDMSWGRLTHPKDLVHVGDHIQVKVLKFDKEKPRVSLGFKQLTPDPWLDA
jgi:small subunit ribosomal protein S1